MRATLVLLAALGLGGRCLSGSGCNAPQAAARTDLDGLDPPVEDDNAPAPKHRISDQAKLRTGQAKPASGAKTPTGWEDDQAQDQADEARLKRKLIICQNCAPPANPKEATTVNR